jgi:RNA polymerase sigma-70 factor, ECF subfamily
MNLPEVMAPDSQQSYGDREAVVTALNVLSVTDRELLYLIYWEQLEVKTAAQVIGCSIPTATVRLHRARPRLRSAISPNYSHPTSSRKEVTP